MDLLCKWCGETKPAEEFIKRKAAEPYSQSNVRCCKLCNAKRNRQRYDADSETRAKQLAANARWRREHRDQQNEATDRYRARNPAHQQAKNRVGHLLRRGYWQRQPCMICGADDQVEAHHDSYAKPHWEAVRWLCKRHHELWHKWLDPLKRDVIAAPLAEVEAKRAEARKKLDQIYRLRKEVSALQSEADSQELDVWMQVQKIAEREFPVFVKTHP